MSTPPPDKVLYVDDEVALLEITQLFLERTGEIAVDITADPLEACEMIMTGQYDVVVSDYQMPVMDGIALLKRVRGGGSQVPFIIFTGRGREEVAIEALNNGADFYIQKGGDPKTQFAELTNAIRQLAGRQKAEIAVLKGEEMLQKTEALAHLGSWVLDCRTGHLTWSDETYRIFGLDPRERTMTYEAFLAIVHPDDRELVDTMYFTSIADGKDTYTVEHRLIRADTGEVRYVIEHCKHLRDESGQMVSSIGMVHDVTERKLAEFDLLQKHKDLQAAYEELASIEEELRTSFDDFVEIQRQFQENERRLADIIDFLPDATFVIDESGHVIAWNRAMEKMAGVLKVDMLGKSDYAYAVPFYGEARPALIDYVLNPDRLTDCPYHVGMVNGETLEGEVTLANLRGREATLMVRASPLYDREGRRVGAIEIVRDVTAQKQAKSALRETKEYLEKLIDHTSSPVAVWNPDFVITRFNRSFERLTGIPADEAIGQNLEILFPPESRNASMDLIRKAMAGDLWEDVEIPVMHRSGSVRIVLWNSANIIGDDGKTLISTIAQGKDITVRKQAEAELRQKHEELQAAHEELTAVEEELRTSFDDLAASQRQLQESEHRLADIINFLPDATFVVDEAGRIIAWNRAIERMTGVPKADILGRGDHAYTVPFYGEARPALIDYVLNPDRLANCPYHVGMVNGEILEGEVSLANLRGKEVTLMVRASPLYDREGRRVGAIEIVRDITAQKQAEAELRENHEELQAAYEELTSIEEELRTSFDDLAVSRRQLQESRDLYRRISESISDVVYVCDFQDSGRHVISRITGAVQEITGYTDEEVLAMRCWGPLVHPDDLPIFEREILSLSPGTSSITELRIVRKDGSIRWIYVSANRIKTQNGGTQLYGGWHDITRRKETEEALRESEQHFRTLANSGQALIWMSRSDAELDYFNETWLAFTGRTLEEETGYGWIEGVHPDDRAECIRIFEDAALRHEPFSMTYRLRRHDGEYRWILDDGTPRYDTRGNFLGYIGHCLDITEHREMEAELQEILDLMRSIVRVAPTGIGTMMDEIFTEVNPQFCEITGYTRDELIGKSPQLLYPEPGDYLTALGTMYAWIEEVGRCTYEACLIRKDGVRIDAQISIAPLDPADLSRGMAFTLLDVTENRAMEREINRHVAELSRQADSLAMANKKLTLMNSITRHDVLNQLTILLGNLAFAQETESGQEISQHLSQMRDAADRIQRQIEFTRDYASLGVRSPEWQRISDAIRPAASSRLPIEDETGDLAIYADPMLVRVFANLMDNTIRHGWPVNRVRIWHRLEEEGDLILVWEDDGAGIPAEAKERIFKQGVGKNTGLGLFLIREILKITSITITETGEPGKGARFEMLVPEGMYRI